MGSNPTPGTSPCDLVRGGVVGDRLGNREQLLDRELRTGCSKPDAMCFEEDLSPSSAFRLLVADSI